jgi:hypothetical protein
VARLKHECERILLLGKLKENLIQPEGELSRLKTARKRRKWREMKRIRREGR